VDSEIEILKVELASLKAGTVTAAGHGTGRGKQGGAGGDRNHAAVGRGRSTETCTKCGKVGHDTAQCFQTGDELAAKAAAMDKEVADILAKLKTSRKVNDAEVKTYAAGCVANKDDKEYVSRAASVLPIHVSPTTKLTSPPSIVIYHGHLSPTQIPSKKYEGSVVYEASFYRIEMLALFNDMIIVDRYLWECQYTNERPRYPCVLNVEMSV
jgi:hypothetical protein